MIMDLIKRSVQTRQWKMIAALLIFTAFSFSLIAVRVFLTHSIMYGFIAWNLFLAWIPFGFSLLPILYKETFSRTLLLIPIVAIWLLFFPNAPYIVTDLYHLMPRNGIPIWYDLMLLASAAWTGMLLGMISLLHIQSIVAEKVGNLLAWLFSLSTLVLCGFGIYLGRFLRWNSWDLMTNPFQLAYDILHILIHPFQNKSVYAITILFSTFLILGYLTIKLLASNGTVKVVNKRID